MLTLTGGLLAVTLAVAAETGPDAARAGMPGRVPGSWVTPRRRGWCVGRAPLRSLRAVVTRRPGRGCSRGCSSAGTGLVRVDALREVVLLLPVLALGAAFGGRWPRPVLARARRCRCWWRRSRRSGCRGSTSRRSRASLVPLLGPGRARSVAARGWRCVLWRRGWRLPAVVVRWLPDVGGGRWSWSRGCTSRAGRCGRSRARTRTTRGRAYVAGMQARQGLPVDGGRTYAEQTVAWLSWYVGPLALVVALVVLALLVRRAVLVGGASGGRRVAAGAARGRPARPCSPWRGPASRLTTRGPTGGCSSRCRSSWRSSSSGSTGVVRRAVAAGRGWVGAAVVGVVGGARRRPRGGGDVAAPGRRRRAGVARRRRPGLRGAGPARRRARRRLPGRQRVAAGRARDVRGAGAVDDVRVARGRRPPGRHRRERRWGGGGTRWPARAARRGLGAGTRGARPARRADRRLVVREDEHVLERRPARTDPLPVRVWLSPVPAG